MGKNNFYFFLTHLIHITICFAAPLRPINTVYNKTSKMDRKVKKDSLCYQVLFNRPLLNAENKYIYGFRIKVDEVKTFSEKLLMEYLVEGVLGKLIFKVIHHGSFEGELDKIWIDLDGNEYKYGNQTRLYCYDATVENMMNYRCDTVYASCENEERENYWITDASDYFYWKAKMDTDDHKQGKNQWIENYYKIQARREVLSKISVNRSENLDYDIQEIIREEWFDAKG